MPRHRILFACFIIFGQLIAQDINEAIRLFNAFQFDKARIVFEELAKDAKNPRIAEVYYYLGRLALNPDSSLLYYRKVIKDYPQSRYADISYLEVAKYYITREDYRDAIITLNELLKNYPTTELKEEILFWLGISYIGIGQKEKGVENLKTLIATNPKSVWSDRAKNVIPKEEPPQDYYAIQVGSYRAKINAQNLTEELRKRGVDARVVETAILGNTFYRVWVGQFPTKEEARIFSTKLDSLGIKGNVVKCQ